MEEREHEEAEGEVSEEMESDLDEMEQRAAEMEERVGRTREDWERKKDDPDVPGARDD